MTDDKGAGGAELDRWQRTAILMVTLGQDLASELLGQFEGDEVEHITRAIAQLKTIPRELQDQVISEFEEDLASGRLHVARGGQDIARNLLETALGPASVPSPRPIRPRWRPTSAVNIPRRSHS